MREGVVVSGILCHECGAALEHVPVHSVLPFAADHNPKPGLGEFCQKIVQLVLEAFVAELLEYLRANDLCAVYITTTTTA